MKEIAGPRLVSALDASQMPAPEPVFGGAGTAREVGSRSTSVSVCGSGVS